MMIMTDNICSVYYVPDTVLNTFLMVMRNLRKEKCSFQFGDETTVAQKG